MKNNIAIALSITAIITSSTGSAFADAKRLIEGDDIEKGSISEDKLDKKLRKSLDVINKGGNIKWGHLDEKLRKKIGKKKIVKEVTHEVVREVPIESDGKLQLLQVEQDVVMQPSVKGNFSITCPTGMTIMKADLVPATPEVGNGYFVVLHTWPSDDNQTWNVRVSASNPQPTKIMATCVGSDLL